MVEPVTVGVAIAWGTYKVIGPTLDGIGKWLATFIPERQANAQKIIENAEKKAETRNRKGSASPRVIASAVNDGSWSSEQVVTAYLGGAIAASIEGERDDDTTIPWVAMVNRLSSDALAVHHAMYATIHRLRGQAGEFEPGIERSLQDALAVCVPVSACEKVLATEERFLAALRLLDVEGLITNWGIGPQKLLNRMIPPEAAQHEAVFLADPTSAGISLFMVGYGFSGVSSPSDFMLVDELGPMTIEDTETLSIFEDATLYRPSSRLTQDGDN